MNKASISVDFCRDSIDAGSILVNCISVSYVSPFKLAWSMIKRMPLWLTSQSLKSLTATPSTFHPGGYGMDKPELVSALPVTIHPKSELHSRRSQRQGSANSSGGRLLSYVTATPSTEADSSVRSSSTLATCPLIFHSIASDSGRFQTHFHLSIHESLRFRQPKRPRKSALPAVKRRPFSPIAHGIA